MRKGLVLIIAALFITGLAFGSAIAADPALAKNSHLQKIQKSGELRVGFESGYVPFCMTDKKGNFIGWEMDFGRRLAKEMKLFILGFIAGLFVEYWANSILHRAATRKQERERAQWRKVEAHVKETAAMLREHRLASRDDYMKAVRSRSKN